jgi:DNA-binding transcriptional ArsR family regulator
MKKPRQEKLGDALKKAIAVERYVEDSEKSVGKEESILMNPTRRDIFQYLCNNPCIRVGDIAKALELATSTAEWHLKKMREKGLVSMKKVGKYRLYHPSEMIDPEDIGVFSLLGRDKTRLICGLVADNPGITQSKLCKKVGMYQQEVGWYTSQLVEKGVLSSVKDGRFKRYYLNQNLEGVLRSDRKRKNHFKKTLIRTLKKNGANPEILRSRDDVLLIQIHSNKDKIILKINLSLNPFS